MGKIKLLDPEVISKIAAGEVVERPASVVKELVENSLDAMSRSIRVEVEGGGRKLIRVTDDGEGMSAEDVQLALQRYSTSKIVSADDLFAVQTFGFRGEALASIGAVSRLRILTRRDGELAGAEMRTEGGEFRGAVEAGCPLGTSVEVKDLFFNIPARLKFLKSQGTELSHIGEVLAKIALAHERVHFQFFHAGKLLANYPVREDPSARLAAALGKEAGGMMHAFLARNEGMEVKGFAGEPELQRSNSRGVHLFVNRRPVRDRLLLHAVLAAYRNLLPGDRYPVAVLFVNLPPAEIDVNVHPGKWEVKFAASEAVHRLVTAGVRGILEKTPWLGLGGAMPASLREAPGDYGRADLRPPFFGPGRQQSFPLRSALQAAEEGRIPFLGQVDRTYLLFAAPEGLLLLDQHAAHERITMERLLKEFSGGSLRSQALLLPEMIELSLPEAQVIAEQLGELARLGFALEHSGGRTFWVKGVPAVLTGREPLAVLKETIAEMSSWGVSGDAPRSFDPLLRLMACHGSIQAGQPLAPDEAALLFSDLKACASPSRCPHGRPTMVKITLADLAKMFARK